MADTRPVNSGKKATLQEVSLVAGVSTATVSRYLNNPAGVSAKLGKRVQAAIDRLGYVSNGLARALASRRSMMMGVIVSDLTDPLTAGILDAFRRELARHRYAVLLSGADPDGADNPAGVQALLERETDGLLLIDGRTAKSIIDLAGSRGMPLVSTRMPPAGLDAPVVTFDPLQATVLAVDHLLGLGHRRFGLLVDGGETGPEAIAALEAVRSRVSAAGGLLSDGHVPSVARGEGMEGRAAAAALLSAPGPRITAVLATSDRLAATALAECRSRGIGVPGDVSIVGRGDSDVARTSDPPLSSVSLPAGEIGRRAAAFLLDRVAGRPADARQILEVRLVERGSTGPIGAPGRS